MLIEFRVKNFRSFRDEQVLSLAASSDKELIELNVTDREVKGSPRVLRSAVVFGPNAGGKSNLLKALQLLKGLVLFWQEQGVAERRMLHEPFLFDREAPQQPTEFEITFLLQGVRHQYGLVVSKERVEHEYLLVYQSAKPQRWFDRRYLGDQEKKYDYTFSTSLKGQKHVWEEATRDNALFLSVAAQLNSEQLGAVTAWFRDNLHVFNEHSHISANFTIGMLESSEEKKRILSFVKTADLSIDSIEVKNSKVKGEAGMLFNVKTGEGNPILVEEDQRELLFHHSTPAGMVVFTEDRESSGTNLLIYLAGPLLDVLKNGYTLFIDELSSLHPLLVRHIVNLFHSPTSNPKGAQLIFSSHDVSLLDDKTLFRRDQIWFVEKDSNQASKLYPFSDFHARKGEALEKRYLQGRYGAVPMLRNFTDGE